MSALDLISATAATSQTPMKIIISIIEFQWLSRSWFWFLELTLKLIQTLILVESKEQPKEEPGKETISGEHDRSETSVRLVMWTQSVTADCQPLRLINSTLCEVHLTESNFAVCLPMPPAIATWVRKPNNETTFACTQCTKHTRFYINFVDVMHKSVTQAPDTRADSICWNLNIGISRFFGTCAQSSSTAISVKIVINIMVNNHWLWP